jgi:DNA modification methylase
MAVNDQIIAERYALYNGDCCEVLPSLPDASVGLSVYSPPFCGLYNYSSHDQDMSNNRTYDGFLEHYAFLVRELARVTKPGRMTAVHCMDIPNPGQRTGYYDFPGRVIALHETAGFHFFGRAFIWKEPLKVAIRTRLQHLTHKQLVKDSCRSTVAAGDQFLFFKRHGENAEPVTHATGFDRYAGMREVPPELWQHKGETDQAKNRLSHWIWRQYASCFWDDIRIDRVLPFRAAKEPDDEKHVHPLQLDAIERVVTLWSNPDDIVLTPFMGVGSEVYGALINGRRGIGVELKASYFRQAASNVEAALLPGAVEGDDLIQLSAGPDDEEDDGVNDLEVAA